VYAGDYDSLFITDSKLTGNHAADGAAIYEYWSYLDLVRDSVNSNSTIAGADGYGGAIDSEYGVVDVTKGSISANTAGDAADPGYGGVGYDYYTDYTLDGVTVNGNKATDGGDGGVFYLYFDQLDITGGSVSHNSVTGTSGSGGAIYIDEGAQVGLHGVTMTGDRVAATVGYSTTMPKTTATRSSSIPAPPSPVRTARRSTSTATTAEPRSRWRIRPSRTTPTTTRTPATRSQAPI
jgi:hypothetical protein